MSLDEETSCMSDHVDHLDRLFIHQELEMAKLDIELLKKELEKKNDKLRQLENRLEVEKNAVAKLVLERDLADAESMVIKQQITEILRTQSCDIQDEMSVDSYNHYVVAHQFVPYLDPTCTDLEQQQEDEFAAQSSCATKLLLEGWQHQERLHSILFKIMRENAKLSVPDSSSSVMNQCHSRQNPYQYRKILACFSIFFCPKNRRRNRSTMQQKSWRLLFRKGNLSHFKQKKYQAVHDDYATVNSNDEDEDTTMLDVASCDATNDSFVSHEHNMSLWLMQELLSVDESNRKCVEDVQALINHQTKQIQEMQRLIYFPRYRNSSTENVILPD